VSAPLDFLELSSSSKKDYSSARVVVSRAGGGAGPHHAFSFHEVEQAPPCFLVTRGGAGIYACDMLLKKSALAAEVSRAKADHLNPI
jgi:hypothetical protein